MHNYSLSKTNDRVPEIKAIAWVFYDIVMLGVGGYTLANSFIKGVDIAEKIFLGLASAVFFGYRIYILHLESVKRRMENEEKRIELNERKAQAKQKNNLNKH